LDGVVNQVIHDTDGRGMGRGPSKACHRYEIALHVDDSEGVREEGERHGFAVVVVEPADEQWVGKVLERVDGMA